VGRDLLGRLVIRRLDGITLAGRVVECEAYDEGDPASHSFRGPTPRNEVMFGPPGHLYVYFTYGMHFCANIVTGRDGHGSAVLLRAVEPLEGLERMAERRGISDEHLLCAGPGRLTQAFGIARAENGADLVEDEAVFLAKGHPLDAESIGISPRIGVNVGADLPWRFFELGSPFLSRRSIPGRGAGSAGR
jgi:DNA-3-methyladenine glycosylase